jgi:hypothetical protein
MCSVFNAIAAVLLRRLIEITPKSTPKMRRSDQETVPLVDQSHEPRRARQVEQVEEGSQQNLSQESRESGKA